MSNSVAGLVGQEISKRWSVLRTVGLITARPASFADRMPATAANGLWPALRFFVKAVGIVIAIEAAFSFAFNTAFSDLVHHAFPILVALTGGVAVWAVLKVLMTRSATFNETVAASLYVGGAALVVMITTVFALLTADFAANYASVMGSACEHRTIMCLLSGNVQYDYEMLGTAGTRETQGASYAPIVLVILLSIAYFTHVLASVLRRRLGVARWRTYAAALVSVIVLSPIYLVLLNGIYRTLYGVAG